MQEQKTERAAGKRGQGAALAEQICAVLDEGKAEDILALNISARSALADYMVIAGGTSARHLSALADRLAEALKAAGQKELRMEGAGSDWLLIDAGDVIIHLFRPEARAFYRLEKIWAERDEAEAVSARL